MHPDNEKNVGHVLLPIIVTYSALCAISALHYVRSKFQMPYRTVGWTYSCYLIVRWTLTLRHEVTDSAYNCYNVMKRMTLESDLCELRGKVLLLYMRNCGIFIVANRCFNGSQLATMKRYIPRMSLPWTSQGRSGLKSSNYTLEIMIFVNMWNLEQFR